MTLELLAPREEDTLAIGRALGAVLESGDVVALTGELGAGKTVFAKGVGEALGIAPARILSPSFTIVTEHPGRIPLFHVDVYRLSGEREAEAIGLDEVLSGEGVTVVEWAEKLPTILPDSCIKVKFLFSDEGGRRLILTAEDAPRIRDFAARCRRYLTGG